MKNSIVDNFLRRLTRVIRYLESRINLVGEHLKAPAVIAIFCTVIRAGG